jgi:hypothetical protein
MPSWRIGIPSGEGAHPRLDGPFPKSDVVGWIKSRASSMPAFKLSP